MTLNTALQVLMQSASRDVRGAGLGYRSTSDAWRVKVAEAWAVAHRRIYKCAPTAGDYLNAGMPMPAHTHEENK